MLLYHFFLHFLSDYAKSLNLASECFMLILISHRKKGKKQEDLMMFLYIPVLLYNSPSKDSLNRKALFPFFLNMSSLFIQTCICKMVSDSKDLFDIH